MDDTKDIASKISELNKYVVALIVILLIGGFGYGAYVLNGRYRDEPEPTTDETLTLPSTNTPSPTEPHKTSKPNNWITNYQNKWGFSISYPSTWIATESEVSEPSLRNDTKHAFTLDLGTNEDSRLVVIDVMDNPEQLDLGNWIDSYSPNTNAYNSLIVDGKPAREYLISPMGGNINQYVIRGTNYIYYITSLRGLDEFLTISSTLLIN